MKTSLTELGNIGKAWTIQRRVIGALLMREVLTRYGRHNIGFLWLFVEPMLFTLGVLTLWTLTGAAHGTHLQIVAFAITGYSSVLLWRNMPGRCIGSIEPNLSLLYHRHVKIIDIFASRLLLEVAGASTSFALLSTLFITIGWLSPPEDVLQVLGGWIMLSWFGASLAFFLGSLAEEFETVDKLWHPFSYIMFPLSGAAFLVDVLPPVARNWVLILPMVHGVEYLRQGYFGSQFTAHYDMGYMALVCMGLSILGLAQTRRISRSVVPQ